ncbi:TPA: hypothetical protein AB5C23_003407, partial [Vibrio cholerae]
IPIILYFNDLNRLWWSIASRLDRFAIFNSEALRSIIELTRSAITHIKRNCPFSHERLLRCVIPVTTLLAAK